MKSLTFLFNPEGKLFSNLPTLLSKEKPKVFISHQEDETYRFQVGVIEETGGTSDYSDVDTIHQVKEWLQTRDMHIDIQNYEVALFLKSK
jgi:hypothetical protein